MINEIIIRACCLDNRDHIREIQVHLGAAFAGRCWDKATVVRLLDELHGDGPDVTLNRASMLRVLGLPGDHSAAALRMSRGLPRAVPRSWVKKSIVGLVWGLFVGSLLVSSALICLFIAVAIKIVFG